MRIDVIHPRELGAPEQQRWQALREANPACASPYLTCAFARAVGSARDDARIAILEDAGVVVGFLPVQRPSPLSAMALGTPICDVQGLIGPADLEIDPAALCRSLKVGHIDFSAAAVGAGPLAAFMRGEALTHIAELPGSANAYDAMLTGRGSTTPRRIKQKIRKLEADHGPIHFETASSDRSVLDTLLLWKQRQCEQTRQPPVWSTPWVLDTMDRLWAESGPDLQPMLSVARVQDTLVCLQLYLRSGSALHLWMIGHDHQFNVYSPGLMFARRFALWAADNGFSQIDYGVGDYEYKSKLATTQRSMAWGSLTRASASGYARRALLAARVAAERLPAAKLRDLPGKAMRRLDVLRGLGLTPPRRPAASLP